MVWDVTDPARPTPSGDPLTSDTEPIRAVAYSPDSGTVATARAGPGDTGQGPNVDSAVALCGRRRSGAAAASRHPAHRARGGSERGGVLGRRPRPGHRRRLPRPHAADPLGHDGPGPSPPCRNPLTIPDTRVTAIAFSHPGRLLATDAEENGGDAVALWDVTDPDQPRRVGPPLTGDPTASSHALAFSPDDHTLAVAGGGLNSNTAVALWDVSDQRTPAAPAPRCPPQAAQ